MVKKLESSTCASVRFRPRSGRHADGTPMGRRWDAGAHPPPPVSAGQGRRFALERLATKKSKKKKQQKNIKINKNGGTRKKKETRRRRWP